MGDMRYSEDFLQNLMDMGSLLGNIFGTILNYRISVPWILTAAHNTFTP